MLTWDSTLAESAAEWAAKCYFQHDPSNQLGENLAMSYNTGWTTSYNPYIPENIVTKAISEAVQGWWDEYEFYTYGTLYGTDSCTPGEQCGHFTQMASSSGS